MNDYLVAFCEVDAIAMLVVSAVIFKTYIGIYKPNLKIPFCLTGLFIFLYVLLDMFWGICNTVDFSNKIIVFKVVSCIRYVMPPLICYFWFMFNLRNTNIDSRKFSLYMKLGTISPAIILILSSLSIYNGWIFNISPEGIYSRGFLYYAAAVVSYSLGLIATILSVVQIIRLREPSDKTRYIFNASFAIWPILFGVLQSFFVNAPMIPVGFSFAYLFIYFNYTDQEIFVDSLTGLSNRKHLYNHVNRLLRNTDSQRRENIFLVFLDLDKFKYVNDTFGHLEGDRILERAGFVFKNVAASHNYFVARYGGDEFIFVGEANSEKLVIDLETEINIALKADPVLMNMVIPISASSGHIFYNEKRTEKTSDFIKYADVMMYEMKREKYMKKAAD